MGCFPNLVHVNVTASIQAYRGLSHREDICVFVATFRQLRAKLNEACGEVKTIAFLGASLLTMEKLKTSFLSLSQ